jgi:alpha 1,3-glucosidase
MWMQYPQIEALFSTDDQYLIGSDLLVKPVTAAGVTETKVQFPSNDMWYDAESLILVSPKGAEPNRVTVITIASNLDKIPVYQRGGSVISRKLRLRRSAALMKRDPYTLYVALDDAKTASGTLYMDDEESFDYERKGEFAEASFTADFSGNVATIGNAISVGAGWEKQLEIFESERMVERIVVMGVQKAPKEVSLNDKKLEFQFSEAIHVLVLRKPGVSALNDWEITITMS